MTREKKEKNETRIRIHIYVHTHTCAEGPRRRAQRSVAAGIGQTATAKRHCPRIAAIVNQLARIVNKSPFYNSTAPRPERHPYEIYRPFSSVSLWFQRRRRAELGAAGDTNERSLIAIVGWLAQRYLPLSSARFNGARRRDVRRRKRKFSILKILPGY